MRELPVGNERQDLANVVCANWAEKDARAALAWAQSLLSGAERVDAIEKVVEGWANSDPQAAMQYASQHPELSPGVFGKIAQAWSQSDYSAAET